MKQFNRGRFGLGFCVLVVLAGFNHRADAVYLLVSNFGSKTIHVLDSDTGALIRSYTDSLLVSPTGMALSPDGSLLYVGNSNTTNDVLVFDTRSGARTRVLTSSSLTFASGLALSPTGTTLYVGAHSNVYAFNTATGSSSTAVFLPNRQHDLELSSAGNVLYAANNWTNTVYEAALPGGSVTRSYDFPQFSAPTGLALSPDGSVLYSAMANDGASSTNSVAVFNTATAARTGTLNLPGEPGDLSGLDITDDGSTLFVSDSFYDVLYRVNTSTGAASAFATSAVLDSPAHLLYTENEAVVPEASTPGASILAGIAAVLLRRGRTPGAPRRPEPL